jgi:hypothetical protein
MKTLAIALLILLPHAGAAPFLMFASTSDPTVFPVLEKFLTREDYAGAKIAAKAPAIARHIESQHQFVLPGSIEGVKKYAGCAATDPGIVMYDIEHWTDTPASEQSQPAKSVAAAARIVHASKCQQFALAPDGQFMGLKEGVCAYDFEAGIYRSIDWTQVDLLSVQAQRLLSDACADQLTVDDYAGFVSRVAAYVKSKNPKILVVSQLSFRYTPPEKIVLAISKLAQGIDGFYLIYPAGQKTPCHYCSAQNVATVLEASRPASKARKVAPKAR